MLAVADRAKEYQRLRDEGDTLLRQDKPAEALARYQQALSFKPDDAYVKRQIQAIQAAQQPAPPPQQPQPKADGPEDGIYSVVEEAPELIGGLKELYSKVNYPEHARQLSIEGRVYVQFVLTENGQVQDAKVIRGIGGGCDEEALRVVREARFVPGKIGGKPVKMRHTLFVTFRLNR
jgi:protein TonB